MPSEPEDSNRRRELPSERQLRIGCEASGSCGEPAASSSSFCRRLPQKEAKENKPPLDVAELGDDGELGFLTAPASSSMFTITSLPRSEATSMGYTGFIWIRCDSSSPRGLFTSENPCRSKKDLTACARCAMARGESGSAFRVDIISVGRETDPGFWKSLCALSPGVL